jgi:hypothetical protein
MNFRTQIPISLQLLKEYIITAKRSGFAATDNKTTLPDQTSVYSYRDFSNQRFAGLIYTDMYNGNSIECGQESITIDLIQRWRNQYYGGILEHFWNVSENKLFEQQFDNSILTIGSRFPEVVSTFLKMALFNLPEEFPVRGPHLFQVPEVNFEGISIHGEWKYINEWKLVPLFNSSDPFSSFIGQERIFLNGMEIYIHAYQGGLIRDKYFPFILE